MKHRIRKQFNLVQLSLGIVVICVGVTLGWNFFSAQKNQAIDLQREVGDRAVNEFLILTRDLEDKFKTLVKLYDLLAISPDQQDMVLSKIRSIKDKNNRDIIDEIVLLNNDGIIISSSDRIRIKPDKQAYNWHLISDAFLPISSRSNYYGPILVQEKGEPFMLYALPLIDHVTGEMKGALAARIRINLILEDIVRKSVGKNGDIFITSQAGRIVAHKNPSFVLKGINVDVFSKGTIAKNITGSWSIQIIKKVYLGSQSLFIVVERPILEALSLTIQVAFWFVSFLFIFFVGSLLGGLFLNNRVVRPLEGLAKTAQTIKSGDFSVTALKERDDELGLLAESFNEMTAQLAAEIAKLKNTESVLKDYQTELELKVAERTKELQKLLTCTKILSSTRDLPSLCRKSIEIAQLLVELDYSSLMLVDQNKKTFVTHDSIGFPESMEESSALIDGQGIASYVAKVKRPVAVEDFFSEDRFALPSFINSEKIRSALSVPLIIDDEVLAVFVGYTRAKRSFTEQEISFCQNFANQVAVAIDNALHVKNLRDSEKKFKDLFDYANDVILVFDLQGTLLETNKATCQRLGYSRDELLTTHSMKFIAPHYRSLFDKRIHNLGEEINSILEIDYIHKDGNDIPFELNFTPIDYLGIQAVLVIGRDLSERKLMEEELLKNRKLESIGILAGGIAHDFNNILAAIIGNINLASMQLHAGDKTIEILSAAEKAALRARNLTQQLLTFSKGGEPVKELSSIVEVIKDSSDFIASGQSVKCDFTFPENLWSVEIDSGQISQVVQNIVLNACNVLHDGGRIDISCENVAKESAFALGLEKTDYIQIIIKDNGPGIPGSHLDKIFDPYFTTSESGAGLGLSITYSIIKKHDGVIKVASEVGQGTSFTIFLKAIRKELASNDSAQPKPSAPLPDAESGRNRAARIMVMDDDPMIRAVSNGLLSLLGYKVILAEDGEKALDLYKLGMEKKEPIDAIIMDLTIPGGMGGKDAVQEILKIDPQVKAIVSSGYSTDPIMANFAEYGFCATLVKPYQVEDIKSVVGKVLADS